MLVQFQHNTKDKYLEVRASGKLEPADYEQFGPKFEELLKQHGKLRALLIRLRVLQLELLLKQHGKLRVLLILDDLHGWTLRELWEEITFDVKHFRDIERMAIVGEKRWHSGMATFCKPFTTAAIRYFEKFEIDDAREWLMKEALADAGPGEPVAARAEPTTARVFWTR